MSPDRGHHASDSLTSWMADTAASNRWRSPGCTTGPPRPSSAVNSVHWYR